MLLFGLANLAALDFEVGGTKNANNFGMHDRNSAGAQAGCQSSVVPESGDALWALIEAVSCLSTARHGRVPAWNVFAWTQPDSLGPGFTGGPTAGFMPVLGTSQACGLMSKKPDGLDPSVRRGPGGSVSASAGRQLLLYA